MAYRNRLKALAYHRNGICGEGFHVALFTTRIDGKNRNMVAITFGVEDDRSACRTAVLDVDMLSAGNVRFGENSWRGDHWHDWMCDQVKAANDPR